MDCCMAADADGERAVKVKEVAQVYERIKAQHPLLLLPGELAHSLLTDALRALNLALSVMKQPPAPSRSVVKAAKPQLSPASADSQAIATRAKKRSCRSSVMMEQGQKSSWVDFTNVPYDDGYEWRKYGEKKINGTSYTRSYFRCTYKDDTGCLATKHVQQKDNTYTSDDNHPLFQVTYNNHHTCKGAAAMNIIVKQEPPPAVAVAVAVLPPPLVEAYYSDLRPPFHQDQAEPSPFPIIGMQQQTSSSATTSSCISGESCDHYYYSASAADNMAAAELASAGDDFLCDLESFLLGDDSFNLY